jgi:hypothetical protein
MATGVGQRIARAPRSRADGAEARMAGDRMDRKEFVTSLGRAGLGGCLCASVLAARAAFGADAPTPAAPEPPATKPGEKSPARAAKRVEFMDAWMPRLVQVLDEQLDEPTRRRLMSANGRACFCANNAEQPRRPEPATPEKISAWVKAHADRGYAMDGDAVILTYIGSPGNEWPANVCGCPMVESQGPKTMSATFCWCSVGNVQELHERVFGRPVKVELLESVLLGQPRCKHRITLA